MTRANLQAQLKALLELLAKARRQRLDPRAAYRCVQIARAERNWRLYGRVRPIRGGAASVVPQSPPGLVSSIMGATAPEGAPDATA